ncbi:hypothetical protein PV325_005560 [Microctonus aethiopoides]|nr:hypothetical protein PV325_005560 [Microctonus aethiopoides]
MSSDSEHISKPSKRVRCRISDSSDSSDDSVIIRINRKRRNNNVFSDESSSDDSDVQPPGLARRHSKKSVKPELIDDSSNESGCSSEFVESETSTEWESDWVSDHIDDSDDDTISEKSMKNMKQRKMNKASVKPLQNSDTDESDGQTEKCPICLLSFRSQEIGTPSSCEHCFCLLCIIEWSKNVNTCPVDRQTFTSIDVRSHLGGEIVKQLPIEPPNKSEEHVQEDPTYCEICRLCDREDRMLLCDGCDSGFHLECLTPPMHQVPIEEWYCSECSPNNQQNFAESVEIDFDEIPDLMAEARGLGVTYGRTRTGFSNEVEIMGRFQHMYRQRLIPRTRQSERVRANIRADRNRAREELTTTVITRAIPSFDPEQPSTSSGIDSISENSRGRSPNNSSSNLPRAKRTANNKTKRSKATSRKKKSRKMNKKSDTILREVRIREYNTDGEEKEIVTYVKVKPQTARRKHNKRGVKRRKKRKSQSTRRSRYCRVGSAGRITNTKTVRNRLAVALGLARRPRGSASTISLAPPNLKSSMPNRSNLINSRFRAGISQVNLFGDNLMLDYVPLGSDDETNEDNNVDGGSVVAVQRRNPTICTNRRRLALKGISNPVNRHESQSVDDLLGSIISSQQFWHSCKKNITLKADGTLLLPTDNKNTEKNRETDKSIVDDTNHVSVNDNNIIVDPVSENSLGTSTINSADIIQAPMYSHSRAGGVGNHNADGGGSFRGNYHDRGNRGHGGQDYGMRDSYSGGGGRPNYGGPGPRDGFGHGDLRPPPDALDFSSNFDNRRRPPGPLMPHFRNRLHPNYRNDMNRQRRFNNMDRGGLFRPTHLPHGPSFPHPNNFQGPSNMNNLPPPIMPPLLPSSIAQPEVNLSTIAPEVEPVRNSSVLNESCVDESSTVQEAPQLERLEGEECDIYGDIETPNDKSTDDNLKCDATVENNDENNGESVMALLPPPAPPSDLLDYDENSKSDKNNESDNEDLVIDDTPKDTANSETNENQTEDIYDPFAVADSDTNDSDTRDAKSDAKENELKHADATESTVADNPLPPPLAPPPTPPDFLSMVDNVHDNDDDDDDEDEEEKGDDCPNFSIYSSETMDVARHTEQELSQQIGPLEPPPLPPDIPDDDDIIVADVQACDLSEIPEPIDPYVESLRKERQTLCKIPSKKISSDSRGKITFKIGNKFKLNNRLSSLYDELDDAVEISIAQEKQAENEKAAEKDKKSVTVSLDVESEIKENKFHKDNENAKSDTDVNGLNVKIDNKTLHKTNTQEEKVVAADISAIEPIFGENSHKGKNTDTLVTSNKSESSTLVSSTSDKTEPISIASTSRDETRTKNVNIEHHEDADDDADDDNDDNDNDDDDDDLIQHSPESITEPDFQLQKDTVQYIVPAKLDGKDDNNDHWDSDGAYTPCKDEMPVRDTINSSEKNVSVSTFESGLEPITPPAKDRTTDDLDDRCKTPIEYAGLGTEAISETDEAINFEEELTLLNLRKEKEMEDGELVDENKLGGKKQSEKLSDSDDASNRKKKKEKREKTKQTGEKNKENISSDNQVAWKKISKNTKERQYREKGKRMESRDKEKDLAEKSRDKNKYREKSKEKTRKKIKDTSDRKKEKRKELPRYDVRKIVAEKPSRPRKDEYGRDIRDLSRSLSRTRSPVRANKRSHSREPRLSRSFSPRMRSRSRSWSRRLARSWSRDRISPANKRSVSRSRRKSPPRDRRSLSRRRSRSILNRRSRRSMSNQRQRRRRSISRKRRTRSRSYSRSRSRSKVRSRTRSRTPSRSRDARIKDKSKKHKSRSRSRRRKRSRTKTPPPRKATSKSRIKKRVKRKVSSTTANIHSITMRSRSRSRSRDRSYSRDKNRSKNWGKSNDKIVGDRESFPIRDEGRDQQPISGQASGWSAQWTPSWSRSRSRTPTGVNRQQHNDHLLESRGWSPSSLIGIPTASSLALPPSSPPSQSSAVMGSTNVTGIAGGNEPHDAVGLPKNLTVILRNKDAIKSKKRKEKRAKARKKPHEPERRKTSNKRNRTPPPSKEVFASGDNILVSVCFNNENASGQLNSTTSHLNENMPLLTTSKRRNREPIQAESSKRPKKDKSKDKRSKSPKVNKRDKKRKSKAAEIAASKKPVAVIDLDQSPFREQTPSPRDVIVLSDDEQDDDHNNNHHNMNINNNGNNNNNVGGAGNSNNVNSNNNNDANNINQIDNIDDDDDDEDENGGNGDIRILGMATLSEQQKRMTSSAVQQHIQLQLMHQQQAEQQQQSGKIQNQEDEKDSQQQDQQQIPHKLHLQQRCSISSDLEQFIAQGPKTPPEPQVKFSINKQPCNLRPASMMHPVFEGEEDEDEDTEADDDDNNDDDNDDEDDDRGNVENDVDDDEGDKCLQGTVGESTRDSSNKLMAKDKSGDNDIEDDGEGRDEEEEEDDNEDIDEVEEAENNLQRIEGQKQTLDNDNMSKDDHKKLRNTEESDGGIKIGPNTPPEPPMSPFTSPDAYDPFDPTKSRSPSPSAMDGVMSNDQKHCESTGTSLTSMKDTTTTGGNEKSDSDKPKIISMVTIKRAISPDKDGGLSGISDSTKTIDNSTSKDQINQCVATSTNANSFATINPVLATVAAAVQRSGIFSVNNPAGFNVQRSLAQANHIGAGMQLNKRTNDRTPQLTNLFMNSVKNLPISMRGNKSNTNRNSVLPQNGNDLPMETTNDTAIIDTSSPYSPGSSLSDGIFDPPSPGRTHHSPSRPPGPSGSNMSNVMKNNSGNNSGNVPKNARSTNDKKDAFDALFGSPPLMKTGAGNKLRMKKAAVKSKKQMSNSKIGVRMDENQLQILDDLPSSAVEMQVKDKFLKKLNRQERVVEEVKLVLKPHYTKKHVTKEEYKDIMRKAVPKICHNRTGEINPKKIAQLIEAYVKRCRNNKRKGASTGLMANNPAKPSRPQKNPWS